MPNELEHTQRSLSDLGRGQMLAGEQQDEKATKRKPGEAWKANEIHEIPHKCVFLWFHMVLL